MLPTATTHLLSACSAILRLYLQVWQYVAGDRPALSRQEFYTAMKLVSLAQVGAAGRGSCLRVVQAVATGSKRL